MKKPCEPNRQGQERKSVHPLVVPFEPRESASLVVQKPENRHQRGGQNEREENQAGDLPMSDIAKWQHLRHRGNGGSRCANNIDIIRNHEIEASRFNWVIHYHIVQRDEGRLLQMIEEHHAP